MERKIILLTTLICAAAWQKIPWVASLTEARRLAEKEKIPIFLFTHDGNIETGRC